MRDSGYGVHLGAPWFRHPIVAPHCTGPEPSSPFGLRLSLSTLDPTSIVDHPPQLLRSHDCNVALERPYACLFLHPLRTFSRRHASFPTPASVLLFSVLVLNTSLRPRITSFRWPAWLRCSPRCLDCLFVVVVALALVPSPTPSVSPALRAPSWPTAESLEPVWRIPIWPSPLHVLGLRTSPS